MRLVHLADLHLGFRQYQRQTPAGVNLREDDVARSFSRAIDAVIALRPDLVCVAGDVFHTVRPTNPAIVHAFIEFGRLRQALPHAPVVVISGNHDQPRSSETLCILRLFESLGIHVVDGAARWLRFPEHDLAVLAVPDMGVSTVPLAPDPSARRNVLVIHGEVEGVLGVEMPDRAPAHIRADAVAHEGWDYVAVGHYHVYRKVGPRAWYSGSLDYVSSNPWGELDEERRIKLGKGFIEHDLETQKHTFHLLRPPREFVDLPFVAGKGLGAAELDDAIAERVARAPGGIDGKVVRLAVRDVPRHVARELDHKRLREYRVRALHFQLDVHPPEVTRAGVSSGSPGRRPSLAEMLREALQARQLPPGVARDPLVALGMRYLAEAEEVQAASGDPAEERP